MVPYVDFTALANHLGRKHKVDPAVLVGAWVELKAADREYLAFRGIYQGG